MRLGGKCNMCGQCCDSVRNWSGFLSELGDFPNEVTDGCPNLMPPDKEGRRLCKVYRSEFWVKHCLPCPAEINTWSQAMGFLKANPGCSLEYVE